MEIKNILDKPYTDKQRNDFIAYYCQNCQGVFDECYEIRETEKALEAWGYTEEERQEQEKQRRNQEIDSKIKELREMSLIDIMNNNKENIQIYNDVIFGLEMSRPSI